MEKRRDVLSDPKVAIIIVNWNGKNNTIECLKSVIKIDYGNVEIILVDNGSNDNSVAEIRQQFPEIIVIAAKENSGTAGGRNIGMKCALENNADYIFFLDNDTVVDSRVIVNLLKAMTVVGEEGILGAKIYYYHEPNKIWYAGTKWVNSEFIHVGMGKNDDGNKYNTISETAYACGCAMFVRKSVIEKIGKFDERIFGYFEETDFCYRAKKAGFRSYYVPAARVWHKVSSSSGGEMSPTFTYFMNRNILLWAERHLPFPEKLKLYNHMMRNMIRGILPPRIGTVAKEEGQWRLGTWETLRKYGKEWVRKYKNPTRKAEYLGVKDYLFRRLGNCPASVKAMAK